MTIKIIALLLAATGQVADVVTTWLILMVGGVETNPLLGSNLNPSGLNLYQ